jgi:glycosyltransferase involved in cell wall biosynthesis
MNRPRFHLVASNVTPADAVTRDALGMADWLEDRGFAAAVYGGLVHPSLRGRARHLSEYARHRGAVDDVLVYHHSVGWPAGFALWQQSHNRKVLRYHNITPGRYVQAYDRPTANLCRRGVVETANLCRSGPTLALAASDFSAAELARVADQPYPIEVVPPFHVAVEIDRLEVDEELTESLSQTINLLFVGRVAPHKGHGRLLRVLGCCRQLLGRGVRLHLVGGTDPRLASYYRDLHAEAEARGLGGLVRYPGTVSPAQLKTYFRHATAFLCLSEHEGFCVPLVEAMRLGVPVVAYRASAVGSTLGEQHPFLWDAPDPRAAAESVRLLVEDPGVRAAVIQCQRQRYERLFTPAAIGRRFGAALAAIVPGVEADDTDVPAGLVPQLA